MPTYEITLPDGRKAQLQGDAPPTEADIDAIMGSLGGQRDTRQPNVSLDFPGVPTARASLATDISGIGNRVLEPLGAIASGIVAEPIAGLAGLVQSLDGSRNAADAVKEARADLTMQPKTPEGIAALQSVAEFAPIKAIGDAITGAEETIGDAGFSAGGPVLGAIGTAVPTALMELLGAGLGRRAGRVRATNVAGQEAAQIPSQVRSLIDILPGTSRIPDASRPRAAANAALFESENIPKTLGDVTQDTPQISREQQLLAQTDNTRTQPLRQRKLEQSVAYEEAVGDYIARLGVPDETGESIKAALSGRLKGLNKDKRALYQRFADANPAIKQIPIIPDAIREAIPAKEVLDDLAITAGDNSVLGVENLLVKYGVITDQAKVDAFLKGKTRGQPNEITPLNVGNLDQLRKTLNRLGKGQDESSRATRVLTAPLVRALDEDANLLEAALKEADADPGTLATIRAARGLARQVKTEFSPDRIAGKLTNLKRDGVTPEVEASQAAKRLLAAPVEDITRTVDSLKGAKGGAEAIGNLKAHIVASALEAALKAPTRKDSGVRTVAGSQFGKYLDQKIGRDKLKAIFKDDPEGLQQLLKLRQIGELMDPPNSTTPKGSAPIILSALSKMSPFVSPLLDVLSKVSGDVAGKARTELAVRKAINANPEAKTAMEALERDFPTLAGFLVGSSLAIGVPEPE